MPRTHGEAVETRLKSQVLKSRSKSERPSSIAVHPRTSAPEERVAAGNGLKDRWKNGRCHDVRRNDMDDSQAHKETRQTLDHGRPDADTGKRQERAGGPMSHDDAAHPVGSRLGLRCPGRRDFVDGDF